MIRYTSYGIANHDNIVNDVQRESRKWTPLFVTK